MWGIFNVFKVCSTSLVETDLSMYNIAIKIIPRFVYYLLAKAIRNEFEM